MSGRSTTTRAGGRATTAAARTGRANATATTHAGVLKAAMDQIRALEAGLVAAKRDALPFTKAAQKAEEKAPRGAEALTLAGQQPALPPEDDADVLPGSGAGRLADDGAYEPMDIVAGLRAMLEDIEPRLPVAAPGAPPTEDPRVTAAKAAVVKAEVTTQEAELFAALIVSQVPARDEARARDGGARDGSAVGACGGGAFGAPNDHGASVGRDGARRDHFGVRGDLEYPIGDPGDGGRVGDYGDSH